MSYLVAVDKNNATTKAWREAAGVDGIPCSFIVGHDNKIVYIGNPLEAEFERTLYAVASGRFDPIADKKGRPNIEAARRAATVRNFKDAALHYNNAIAIDPKTFAWAAQERYKMHLNQERNPLAAAVYAKQFMETYAGDAIGLGDFAVMIVSDTDIQERDIESAKAAAEKMIAVGGRNSPAVLERLAVVQFHTGQVQEAVDTQMEAWMLASAAEKAAFKLRLDAYRAAANRKGAAETRAGNR